MKADAAQLSDWLMRIDTFNATPGEGTTRAVYTKEFYRAREYLKKEMQDLGLEIHEDCVGNIYGEYKGRHPECPPVWTGSHIDTVPHGGRYDGMAGVFAALEVIRMMKSDGYQPKRSIFVNVYAGEEMSRFGMCCIGSRAIVGRIHQQDLKDARNTAGESIFDVLSHDGFEPERFNRDFSTKPRVHASLELHIEQNRILQDKDISIGIVTGICAPTNLRCEIHGIQSHAGGTSMEDRRDAFMASAEIALALEHLAKVSDSEYITGTVGAMKLEPGAANVIPGQADFSIDIRSISVQDKDDLVEALQGKIDEITRNRGVTYKLEQLNNDTPYICSPHIRELLHESAKELELPVLDMISGAYHDSLMLGDITDASIIFIPCKDGISHDRKESIDMDDLAKGTDLLAATLRRLSEE